MKFKNSFNKIEDYIKKEQYKGYDPYDTLNSWIPFKQLGKWPAAIATQIQKRNPINIRPLLGIKKDYNPKAMGLFLQAYSILYKKTNDIEYLEKADYFFNWLKDNYSKGYSGYCWGYNFPWANPKEYKERFTPSSVVTGFVCKGIWEYYRTTQNKQASEVLKSALNFILNDLPEYEDETGLCISYTPAQKDICYNASLLAGEVIAINYNLTQKEEYKDLCKRIVNFVTVRQHKDGKWMYSQDIENKTERHQIDFHQGYVLESIYEIKQLLKIKNNKWEESLKKGMKFYKEMQFFSNGSSYWRWPKKYPVEIHNQAQGIITFLKLKKYYPNSEEFASSIAKWTINNMQAKDGHFYYQNHKYYKHKISYMRWSNAWMFLALSMILQEKK